VRDSLMHRGLLVLYAVSLLGVPLASAAQGNSRPAGYAALFDTGESPAMVLTMYLYHRNVITRTRPLVIFCGPYALAWISDDIVRGMREVVDSVSIAAECPDTLAYGVWARHSTENRETVWVASMTFGRFRSEIVAFAKPYRHPGEPPYARGRLERFIWDHRQGLNGRSLIFSEFQPPH
jgi:hypothetical protein